MNRPSPDLATNLYRAAPSAPAGSLPVWIRWMIHRDMPEVLQIEGESFDNPWTDEDFVRVLWQYSVLAMIAEHEERVVGFMVYQLSRSQIHLVNFAVDPSARRRGVGAAMIEHLQKKLSTQRRKRIVLEVRESNLGAQCFFRAVRFRAVAVLRNIYCDTREDAYRMVFNVNGSHK